MKNKKYTTLLLNWYFKNFRSLPWRNTRNPYRIWLSEMILQQTRVKQGLPYYESFINRFPTIWDLANASEDEVMRVWQGLGYYTRARNLHKCAKVITEKYKGNFPRKSEELISLPGIGPYTAAAIASISFAEKVPVIDGNVFRVLSRLFGISENINSVKSKQTFFKLAAELVPEKDPGDYNQAVMEFGALQCIPKNPDCEACILHPYCYAYRNKLVDELPVRGKKMKPRERHFHYLVLVNQGRIYFQKRKEKDIWQGLYQFLMIESEDDTPEKIFGWIRNKSGIEFSGKPDRTIRHILSHQIIMAHFYVVEVKSHDIEHDSIHENHESGYFTRNEIEALPKPVLIENYLKERFF